MYSTSLLFRQYCSIIWRLLWRPVNVVNVRPLYGHSYLLFARLYALNDMHKKKSCSADFKFNSKTFKFHVIVIYILYIYSIWRIIKNPVNLVKNLVKLIANLVKINQNSINLIQSLVKSINYLAIWSEIWSKLVKMNRNSVNLIKNLVIWSEIWSKSVEMFGHIDWNLVILLEIWSKSVKKFGLIGGNCCWKQFPVVNFNLQQKKKKINQ